MVNKMILQGRLTRDPEGGQTQGGTNYCRFTVAWSEKYGERETQLFMDCTAWGKTGDMICNHFSKGKEIIVDGKLETRKWVDSDGGNRSAISMNIERVHFCGPRQGGGAHSHLDAARGPVNVDATGFRDIQGDGELPF